MPAPLVTLRCQTVVDGVLAYVKMPIALEIWDSVDEAVRDRFRKEARTELRIAVAARVGENQVDGRFDDLPVWEEHPDRCEVECIGGPMDGQRVTLSDAEPPPMVVLPAPFRLQDVVASAAEPAELIPTVAYSPLTDEYGFSSRARDGAWRYAVVKQSA